MEKEELGYNGNGIDGKGNLTRRDSLFHVDPIKMTRFFSYEDKSPFEYDIFGNPIKYIEEDVSVADDKGNIVFIQKNVRRPISWSSLAIKVVASKYFWGDVKKKDERERSVEQLIGRVSRYLERQALAQGYFNKKEANILRDEIAAICLNQMAVFNSPVWFNCGIQEYDENAGGVSTYVYDIENNIVVKSNKMMDSPQCSACFILGMKDNMDSIMEVQVAEANLFKAGSGCGSNRSVLRSSKETLTGGGRASGPVSFMRGYDSYASVIKSGGKTRRAAKMEILNVDHPDIIEFIEAKSSEEKKAWALIEQGYDGGLNGTAYGSIAFQNCNMSVRVNDEFMKAVKENGKWATKYIKSGETCETLNAKEILNKIAEGTYLCGDPGIQNDTIINKYHTCKNSGRIEASNPCSEFMFLNDTACNLASINLLKFLTPEGLFDVQSFKKVIKYFITAMDIKVDGSSYPTAKIAENSHRFRPLGLGYANLGALLMSLGLPYDSPEGRAVAAAVTAIMCGEAYKTSAELAGLKGPFKGYEENRECMLDVIKMHREHVREINVEEIPSSLRYLINEAWDSWSEAYDLGEKQGYRNSQATVLAPTGTIAFMMDCETTGIEPDISLVKYKVLAGGGMLKIVNRAVPFALARIGYTEDQIKSIIEYIDKNDTIEGAPFLSERHLPIFDCAFKPAKGKRSIGYEAHIEVMAVTQPFISGAISKTINIPQDSSIEEIARAYMHAWERGLKAVAIYRENSKRSQPLNTQRTEGEVIKKKETIILKSERKKLPQTRRSITHKFDIAGHEGFITVGLYDSGDPGEIFITMHKQGSTIRGLIDAWATSVSLNLQYGATVNDLFKKFRHQKFEPAGFVKNLEDDDNKVKIKQIRTASSIVDYVAQFMINNFSEGIEGMELKFSDLEEKIEEEQSSLEEFEAEGITCPICGGPAKRIGNCSIMCTSCKQTTRNGCGE